MQRDLEAAGTIQVGNIHGNMAKLCRDLEAAGPLQVGDTHGSVAKLYSGAQGLDTLQVGDTYGSMAKLLRGLRAFPPYRWGTFIMVASRDPRGREISWQGWMQVCSVCLPDDIVIGVW